MAVIVHFPALHKLIRDHRRGDRLAFERILALLNPRFDRQVRQYCRYLPSSAHDDARQQALWGLLLGLENVDLGYCEIEFYLLSWSRSYLSKLCRQNTRMEDRREDFDDAMPLFDEHPSPEDDLRQAQARDRLYFLCDQLEEPLRTIAMMRFLPDAPWSVRAIARHLGVERKRVRALLDEAQKQLRELENGEITERALRAGSGSY